MTRVVVGNNVKRSTVIVPGSTTPREVLENEGIDYARGIMHLDGVSLSGDDLDSSFEELGVGESCFLLNVVKADNA